MVGGGNVPYPSGQGRYVVRGTRRLCQVVIMGSTFPLRRERGSDHAGGVPPTTSPIRLPMRGHGRQPPHCSVCAPGRGSGKGWTVVASVVSAYRPKRRSPPQPLADRCAPAPGADGVEGGRDAGLFARSAVPSHRRPRRGRPRRRPSADRWTVSKVGACGAVRPATAGEGRRPTRTRHERGVARRLTCSRRGGGDLDRAPRSSPWCGHARRRPRHGVTRGLSPPAAGRAARPRGRRPRPARCGNGRRCGSACRPCRR